MSTVSKEGAYFSGMKLLGLLLELALLFLSLAPDSGISVKFVSAVLLAVLSASFSSLIAFFDDEVFVVCAGWPRFMRGMAVASLVLGFVLFVGSVALLYVANVFGSVGQWWWPTAFAIVLMCLPRMIVYGFIFAMDVRGLTTPTYVKVDNGIAVIAREFEGR